MQRDINRSINQFPSARLLTQLQACSIICINHTGCSTAIKNANDVMPLHCTTLRGQKMCAHASLGRVDHAKAANLPL